MKTIPLHPTGKGPSGTALIDDDLFEWASKYRWKLRPDGYAGRGKGNNLMHRLIAMACEDEQVHHENDNRTDNRRANLKVMTLRAHNRLHWKKRAAMVGQYRGVYPSSGTARRFVAHLLSGEERIHLGTFATAEEAAACWNDAARKQWGEEVYQNPVDCSYTPLTKAMLGPKKGRFKGVHFEKETGKWIAQAPRHGGNQKKLGRFTTEEEAARAYNEAAIAYWGEGNCFLNDV